MNPTLYRRRLDSFYKGVIVNSRGHVKLNGSTEAIHFTVEDSEHIDIHSKDIIGYITLSKKEAIDLVGFIQELWRDEFGL